MKTASALATGMLCLLATATASRAESPRLIQVSAGSRVWMSEREVIDLAMRSHADGHCGGFMDVTEHQGFQTVEVMPFSVLSDLTPRHPEQVNALLPELSAQKLQDGVAKLASFKNRFYKSDTGVQAAHWIRDQFLAYAGGRTDVTVELVSHAFKQPSVIARIQGQGDLAKERVVIGAHEDSVNWSSWSPSPNDVAPGADDDASGVATVLEVFRVLAQSGYRPDRTLEFMTYAGEELGLLGSQDIAKKYREQGHQVAAVLQMDMTMFPGKSQKITFISDHVDNSLTRFLETLTDTYVKFPWQEASCGYACSDHASWSDAGYPSAFPFEAPLGDDNPNIHTTRDTWQNGLDSVFGLHFAKLGVAFAVEIASK